jgi:hypothetical protein
MFILAPGKETLPWDFFVTFSFPLFSYSWILFSPCSLIPGLSFPLILLFLVYLFPLISYVFSSSHIIVSLFSYSLIMVSLVSLIFFLCFSFPPCFLIFLVSYLFCVISFSKFLSFLFLKFNSFLHSFLLLFFLFLFWFSSSFSSFTFLFRFTFYLALHLCRLDLLIFFWGSENCSLNHFNFPAVGSTLVWHGGPLVLSSNKFCLVPKLQFAQSGFEGLHCCIWTFLFDNKTGNKCLCTLKFPIPS